MGLDQLFSARPMIGAADYRMPLKGLYLCGSGAHPGGGVTGAPGHNAAHAVLADRRFWKRRPLKPLDGHQGARPQPGAGRPVVHAIARRPRRRSDQDRAARAAATTRATGGRRGTAKATSRVAAYFLSCNRGKKSAAIDFAQPEGAALVRKLAARCRRRRREFQGRRAREVRARRGVAARRQPAAGLCLDHRLRPGRALRRPRRLRFHHPGHGRADEHHRPARRRAGRRADAGRGRGRRPVHRHVHLRRDPRRALSAREDAARARTSTWRCSTRSWRCSPTRRRTRWFRARTRRGRATPTPISCPTSRSTRPISRSSSPSATTASSRGWPRFAAIRNGPSDERFATNGARVANRAEMVGLVGEAIRQQAGGGVARAARSGGNPGRPDQPHQPGAGRRPGAAPRRWCGRSPACRWSARRCGSTASARIRDLPPPALGEHTDEVLASLGLEPTTRSPGSSPQGIVG